jgi:hypothetical protein
MVFHIKRKSMLETHHIGHHYHQWQEQQHGLYNVHYKTESFHHFKCLLKLPLLILLIIWNHFLNPDRAKN